MSNTQALDFPISIGEAAIYTKPTITLLYTKLTVDKVDYRICQVSISEKGRPTLLGESWLQCKFSEKKLAKKMAVSELLYKMARIGCPKEHRRIVFGAFFPEYMSYTNSTGHTIRYRRPRLRQLKRQLRVRQFMKILDAHSNTREMRSWLQDLVLQLKTQAATVEGFITYLAIKDANIKPRSSQRIIETQVPLVEDRSNIEATVVS